MRFRILILSKTALEARSLDEMVRSPIFEHPFLCLLCVNAGARTRENLLKLKYTLDDDKKQKLRYHVGIYYDQYLSNARFVPHATTARLLAN